MGHNNPLEVFLFQNFLYSSKVCDIQSTVHRDIFLYGQKTCPKHVEFYSKNKFELIVNQVGCIIRTRIKQSLQLCIPYIRMTVTGWHLDTSEGRGVRTVNSYCQILYLLTP